MKRFYTLIICLVLLALVAGTNPARAQRQTLESSIGDKIPAATDTTFVHFFMQDPATSTVWWNSHTIIDATGGFHVAFYDNTYIHYAHCAANCDNPANWLELPLFTVGDLDSLDEPTLGVGVSGHPRLMWYAEYSGDTNYYYAECNTNCTDSAANWTSVAVTRLGAYGYPQKVGYAALDTQSRPHLVYAMSNYPDYGFYYLSCETGCITASNWYTTSVVTPNLRPDELQLVFDPNGRPRVVGYDDNNSELVYAECNSSCATAANWGSVGLFGPIYYLAEYGFALRVDAQGRPRIAYYDGNANNNVLYYAWSNASPLTTGGWHSYTLNYPTDTDYWSLDLAINSQGRPSVAYATDTLNMSYVTCTANCETTSPTWQQQYIETEDDLNTSDPIPTNPGCVSSTWMVIGYPSLALDAANNPNVSYWVRHGQFCYDIHGNLQVLFDAKSIRFATGGGTVQNGLKVYLPLLTR